MADQGAVLRGGIVPNVWDVDDGAVRGKLGLALLGFPSSRLWRRKSGLGRGQDLRRCEWLWGLSVYDAVGPYLWGEGGGGLEAFGWGDGVVGTFATGAWATDAVGKLSADDVERGGGGKGSEI